MQEPFAIAKMPRRAFLAWGSALAVGALGGKAFDASALPVIASPDEQADAIAIGYGAPLPTDASGIIEARCLAAGDSEFVRRGVRVTIFGLEGMESAFASDGMKSLAMDVAYPEWSPPNRYWCMRGTLRRVRWRMSAPASRLWLPWTPIRD